MLQIEELFERFRNLPQSSRAVILEKIRIKLLEEFNGWCLKNFNNFCIFLILLYFSLIFFQDFIIEENDNAQNMIVEIPFSENAELIQRNENYIL